MNVKWIEKNFFKKFGDIVQIKEELTGNQEEFQIFMDRRNSMPCDMFEQDDLFSKRKDIPSTDSDKFHMLFERFDDVIKIVEKFYSKGTTLWYVLQ